MNDLIARIGLALRHLSDNSTVNGPARQEIERLTAELQSVETNISDIVAREVARQMEGVEGRMVAHLDGNLEQLAADLEAADIDFTPVPAVRTFPPAIAEIFDTSPAPTTGNIPAAPVEEAPITADAHPLDIPAAAPEEVVEAPAVEPGTPPTEDADQTESGSKIAEQDPPAADAVALQMDPAAPNVPAADPEPVSTVVAGVAPDDVQSASTDQLAEQGAGAQAAINAESAPPVDQSAPGTPDQPEEPAADALTMVQGGGSDVIG